MWGLSPYCIPCPGLLLPAIGSACRQPGAPKVDLPDFWTRGGHVAQLRGQEGQVVPWPCVLWPGRGNSCCCTSSRTGWGSHQERGSSCDPQTVSPQPPTPPVSTDRCIGSRTPSLVTSQFSQLRPNFPESTENPAFLPGLMCAPAEVGLLGAGNAWDHGFRMDLCTQGLAVLLLCLTPCACMPPRSLSPSVSVTSDALDCWAGSGQLCRLPRPVPLTFLIVWA